MTTPAKQATLLFLIKENKILLAMKKRGLGVDLWNGVGGKPEPDESIEKAAVRECQEEIDVTPEEFKEVAALDFYFAEDKAIWNQRVFVYLCTKWSGVPKETEEMRPEWYDIDKIPYENMWEDDKHWLPKVLEGKYVTGTFNFDNKENLLDFEVSQS